MRWCLSARTDIVLLMRLPGDERTARDESVAIHLGSTRVEHMYVSNVMCNVCDLLERRRAQDSDLENFHAFSINASLNKKFNVLCAKNVRRC